MSDDFSYGDDTELARDLSLFDITMIGVGAMIGAGIFVLTGLSAGQAGPGLVMAFAFNGFITIFTGMVYAELRSAIPEAGGGGYLWVREALGRSQAFLAGWMSWFAHAVAGSLYTLGFGAFVHLLLTETFGVELFQPISLGLVSVGPEKAFAALAGVLFTYINFRGAKETGLAGNVVTLVKVTVILVFIVFRFGALLGNPAEATSKFQPFLPRGFSGIFIAMGLTREPAENYLQNKREELAERDIEIDIAVEAGDDIAQTILEYAHENEFDTIIIGQPQRGSSAVFSSVKFPNESVKSSTDRSSW